MNQDVENQLGGACPVPTCNNGWLDHAGVVCEMCYGGKPAVYGEKELSEDA